MKGYGKRISAWILAILLTVNMISPDVWAETETSEKQTSDIEISAEAAVEEAKKGDDEDLAAVYEELQERNEEEEEPLSDDELNEVLAHYAQLQKLFEENPDYLGIAVPFFLDKQTEETPLGAIEAVIVDGSDEITLEVLDQTILGMIQSLQAYIQYYGDQLLAVRDQALAALDDDMSDMEKCLVLHDFLANWCEFDVAYLEADELGLDNSNVDGFMKSTVFGALVDRSAVCIGYASAYAYLVQCAFPEIYKNADGTWKTREEIGDDYMIDIAKIKSPERHYFNAVKLDGQWYYVDTNFDDIMVQHKQGVRVESEGNLHHIYFLYSHEKMLKLEYNTDDNIDTAYKELCTDDSYENAWFRTINTPISYDEDNWYFVRGQVDTRKKPAGTYVDKEDQMIARNRKTDEETVLIDYKTGQVKGLDGTELGEDSEILNEYQADLIYNRIYAGLQHTLCLYDGKIYFNMGNKVFCYDMDSGKISLFKEYNQISAKRDPDVRFIGDSFYTTDEDGEDVAFIINDRPLSSLYIDSERKMIAFLATNYTYGSEEKYSVESKNYRPSYGSFGENRGTDDLFLWCANVKDITDMEHALGSEHEFEKIIIKPTCIHKGYEELRCSQCGISQAGSRENDTDKKPHHYVYDEKEETNICTMCGFADGEAKEHNYGKPEFVFAYEKADGNVTCQAVFTCTECDHVKKVDCKVKQEMLRESSCGEEGLIRAKASCGFQGESYEKTEVVDIDALGHENQELKIEFIWSDDKSLCYAHFACDVCGKEWNIQADIKKDIQDSTYFEEGKAVYTASCQFEGRTYEDKQSEVIPMKKAEAKLDQNIYRLYTTEKTKAKLISNYEEDGFVSIESSDENVAKVSKYGTITAVSPGTAEITAETKTGEKIEAVVVVKIPKVTLTATSVPLQLKKSTTAIKVKSKIATDEVKKWSSSNSSVAYVSQSGKITAKRTGTAKITVTMKSGATATCTVKVQNSPVRTTKLYLNRTRVTLSMSGTKTFKIVATRYPITSLETITYKSSSTSVATVSKYGTITAKKAGTATITVTCGRVSRKITVTVKK